MKLFALGLFLTVSTTAFADWKSESKALLREYGTECRTATVSVDEVIKNEHIKGRVVGLPTQALDKFKVVFYVKTNRWYVHPYTQGEDGYSYSTLTADGEFSIRTVLRVPSKSLAVVVMPKQVENHSQHWLLKPFLGLFGGVTKYNCTWTTFAGNGDFKN